MNKRFCIALLLLAGCSASRFNKGAGKGQPVTYAEKPQRSFTTIDFGVPAMGKTAVNYTRNGKTAFKVILEEPKVIVVADKPEPWGFYQFPTISALANGDVLAEWSMHSDDITSYGLSLIGSATSSDRGKNWRFGRPDSSLLTGFKVPNGDMIRVVDPKPVKVGSINMPPPVARTNFKYRKTNFTFYRLDQMPRGTNGIFLTRRKAGESRWTPEEAGLKDPMAVRYSSKDLVPVVWWGDIHTMKDGSLLAGVYPGYYMKPDGEVDKQMGVVFHRSTDGGHNWSFQGRISFTPDRAIDDRATDRIGFSEPAYEVLADGSLLCVIRSADGDGVTNGVGNGPMYASRSFDMGVSWSHPQVIAPAGALPRLLQLQNGVTVLTSGRPGVQLRFNKTGDNSGWTDAFEMLPYDSKSMEVVYLVSCGYTGLLATGPNRFLFIYSDFKHKNDAGEERKAIKIREVTVNAN